MDCRWSQNAPASCSFLSNVIACAKDGRRFGRLPTVPRSCLSEIERELRAPCVELRQLPGAGFHRKVLVPGTRLAHAQLGNEYIHLGIELDQNSVGVVVVGGQIVTRSVAGRPPERRRTRAGQLVARGRMSRAVFQLEGDVMNSRLGDMYKVD